ncbi:MAG: clostripain-related cysteine peptidase [Armatimonadetes bacterium]|nr:clostripain-related cysteine peptidase [Armatimonadota bacterium]
MRNRIAVRSLRAAWVGLVAAFVVAGCGGGGGGRSSAASYAGSVGTLHASLTIDGQRRLTVTLASPALGSDAVAAQSSLDSAGQFATQTADGLVQVSGRSDTGACSLTVTKLGQAPISVTLTRLAAPTAGDGAWAGSYQAASGANRMLATIAPDGSGTVWVQANGVTSGGSVTAGSGGAWAAADGSAAGTLRTVGGSPSCSVSKLGGAASSVEIPLVRTTRAKWTLLVYVNAANNLQPYGPLNVNQMEKIGSSADLNLVVQWKQASCATCGAPSWISTRRYYVTRDTDTSAVTSPIIDDLGAGVDMGSWQELNRFIAWGQQRYPADRYAVVIWNHGAGWRPTHAPGKSIVPNSVSIDDSTQSEIQTWQLPQALNVSPKVDMVIFDASLMQMAEVAYELRNSTGVMVGSEESPPGEGYVYDGFLADLAASPTMTAKQLGQAIVTRTLAAYGAHGNNTQSVIDLTKMETVASALNAFANQLLAKRAVDRAAVYSARIGAESFAYADNRDLYDYAGLVRTTATTPDLVASAAGLQTALSDAIVAEGHGTLHADAHGLAVYLPAPASYLTSYANLALARTTDWDSWLQLQPATP